MGSTFGALFRVTTFGESHGPGLGAVIDGCPPRLPLDVGAIQAELDRRRPGQSRLTSQRKEGDRVEILSGVQGGVTLGTPIAMLIRNEEIKGMESFGAPCQQPGYTSGPTAEFSGNGSRQRLDFFNSLDQMILLIFMRDKQFISICMISIEVIPGDRRHATHCNAK